MADAVDPRGTAIPLVTPRRRFDELALPPAIERQLADLAGRLRARRQSATEPRRSRDSSSTRGLLAIFTNESGVDFRLAAEAVAAQAGVSIVRVDLSRVGSKWIGETEKNLGLVFRRAEESGAVLIFDEADALFGGRGETTGGAERYVNLETAYLLQRIESFDGLVILTSNRRDRIGQAVLQRSDLVLPSSGPSPAARPPRIR
jgi:AAA+ superfamily predicted ATPase